MNTHDLFGVAALAIILNCIILYLVISSATKTDKKMKHIEAQTLLLMEIAFHQGADPEKLKSIMNLIP